MVRPWTSRGLLAFSHTGGECAGVLVSLLVKVKCSSHNDITLLTFWLWLKVKQLRIVSMVAEL